jgi:multidrug efflux pump
MFKAVPPGFVPAQDKAYLIGFAQLPDAASLDRTDAVIRKMSDIAKGIPGVESSIAFPGLSINGFTNAPNAGIVFVGLKPFDERKGKEQSGRSHRRRDQQAHGRHRGRLRDGAAAAAGERPGHHGGFKMMIEDRGNLGYDELYKAVQALHGQGRADKRLAGVFSATRSTCRSCSPTSTA